MFTTLSMTAIFFVAFMTDVDADAEFIARVEHTPWLDRLDKIHSRIDRDADGNIEGLYLSGMRLSAEDFAALGRIKTLRRLGLSQTNVTDLDLRQLRHLPRLRGMSLSNTEITDVAIDELLQLKSLESLCLGNVAISPESIDRLKNHYRSHDKRLGLGYTQRKLAEPKSPM